MTRADALKEYKVEHGYIRSPGKFEGERVYVPYFYELFLDGCAEDDGDVLRFVIAEEDMTEFPELTADGYKVDDPLALRMRDDGFVCRFT